MGNRKKKLARKEGSDVCAKQDIPNLPNPPLADIENATIEDIDDQTARMAEDYERLKAQLDEQNLKLEHLTQRRTTQQALSNPNASSINRMFSKETSGLYIYKGSRTCCLDASSKACTSNIVQSHGRCKHDFCARAYSTGISGRELDTLQWYDMRVQFEKTLRMKDALLKQRDVELVRIKHDEDEEQARAARRANKKDNSGSSYRPASTTRKGLDELVCPQDLATIIFESRMTMMQIHKYNIFIGARQRTMEELAKCSDVGSMARLQKSTSESSGDALEKQLRSAQIRSESLKKDVERYTMKIEEAVRASRIVADWQRGEDNFVMHLDSIDSNARELCALVTGLLTDLGMPVEMIGNIQHAQSALGHIMQQPVSAKSAKVQKTLDHIKDVINNSRTRSGRSTASSPNAASYTPMPTSSGDLRNRIISHSVKYGESAVFATEVYSELIHIEDAALIEIHDGYQSLIAFPDKLAEFLENVKEKAVATSPKPEITGKMLDILVSTWYDMSKGFAILTNLDELSDQALLAEISGLVFARAERKVEWLRGAFLATEAMLDAVSIRPLHARVTNALQRVQKSVQERTTAGRNVTVLPKRPQEPALTSARTVESISRPQILPASRLETEEINSGSATDVAHKGKNMAVTTPVILTTSLVPGPARRKLLPRGERHQNPDDTLEATAKVAGMGTNLAKKMSDFCVLRQKVYERAGLALSPEATYYMNQIKRFAYEPGILARNHRDCECPPCIARRTKSADKTSKFTEGFSDTFSNAFEVTIDGRAVEEDELLGYGGATVQRIRSIASGEASLEYICWIAHKVGEEADKVEAAGEDWGSLLERFENFFTYHAEIPLELELALEVVKGEILPPPDYREFYPSEQWPIIDEIFAIMGRIEAQQLKFENGTDDWELTRPMVPKPLNLRRDRLDLVGKIESAETTTETLALGEKQLCSARDPQTPAKQTETERLRSDRNQNQRQALQAQINSTRESHETNATLPPEFLGPAIQTRFNAYNAAAWPIINYISTLTEDKLKPEEDLRLVIAVKVQMQHLDCVRMLQLVAEFRGWDATTTQMKEHLDRWGFREDDEGHYPDFWDSATSLSDDEDEERGRNAE